MTGAEKAARAAIRKLAPGMRGSLGKDGNRKWFRKQMEKQSLLRLIEFARAGDPDALNLVRERAKAARTAGEVVPADLHAFVWEVFIDGKPTAPPGRNPRDRVLRNLLIANLVKIVTTDFGFLATRGRESASISACALVADELRKVDRSITERSVEEAWLDIRKETAVP